MMKPKGLFFLLLGAAILAGLFMWLKPAATPSPMMTAPETAQTPAVPAPVAAQDYAWVIQKGTKVSGPEIINATQGETITLILTSDRADELHVHGYDLHTHIKAGEPATLRFVAERSGRFTMELHRSHLELGALEIQPR